MAKFGRGSPAYALNPQGKQDKNPFEFLVATVYFCSLKARKAFFIVFGQSDPGNGLLKLAFNFC